MLKVLLNDLIDFIFPNQCVLCHTALPRTRNYVCAGHFDDLERVDRSAVDSILMRLPESAIDHLFIAYQYDSKIRLLIHLLKYSYGKTIAGYLAEELAQIIKGQKFDLVTGVPLNPAREKERGYNQSYLLGRHLARELGLPFGETLIRKKNTKSQTRLNRNQRLENVQGAFELIEPITAPHILIVDDLITTGSTINACAAVLKANSINKITGAAIATPVLDFQFQQEREPLSLTDELMS